MDEPKTDPVYDLAHRVSFAADAAGNAAMLIRAGKLLDAYHELERAMNEVGEALDLQEIIDKKTGPWGIVIREDGYPDRYVRCNRGHYSLWDDRSVASWWPDRWDAEIAMGYAPIRIKTHGTIVPQSAVQSSAPPIPR